MLAYSEIKEKKYIVLDGDPYEVLDSQVTRKQARKPVNQTKLRNLITGSVRQQTFHASDVVEEAGVNKRTVIYSFKKDNRQNGEVEYWFYEDGNKANRFMISEKLVGDKTKFMKENSPVDALYFGDKVVGISLPLKVTMKVVDAPPAVRGNTATGADKLVTIETGAQITVPIFIKEGDSINIKTDTGEYTERSKD